MPIATPLTSLLGIKHPVLLAPMDTLAGARLVRAVSEAGGFGILGGGYGDKARLEAETAKLRDFADRSASASSPGAWPSSLSFSTSRSRQSRARSCCRSAIPQPLRRANQAGRRAPDLPGAERGHGEAGARCRRRHPDRAGHRGGRARRLAHHARHRARDDRSRGRPRAGGRGRRHRRRARARGDDDARRLRRADGHALLCQRRG